jgi:hypothetical protein
MRIDHILCFILLPLGCWSQVNEDFSDGDFTTGPNWMGNNLSFIVNEAEQLQLDETNTGVAHLSTISHTTRNGTWEFDVKMKFNPSSQNFCRVYLISDLPDLAGELNGYYVQIGGSKDEVSLHRQNISNHIKIITGTSGFLDTTNVEVNIRVTRNHLSTWSLFAKYSTHHQFQLVGTVEDTVHFRANYFGFHCQFTSSRAKAFFFDNILVEGEPFKDTKPPQILSLKVLGNRKLEVLMSEPVQALSFSQFMVTNLGSPIELLQTAFNTWEMTFPIPFQIGVRYLLNATELKDLAGNTSSSSLEFSFWKTGIAEVHDLIFSEIMADPSPAIQLPEKEYLEIHNRSNKAVNLLGWTIADATKQVTLPEYIMVPGSYLVLCPNTNVNQQSDSLNLLGLASWPTLNNGDDLITLADSTEKIIHFVNYQDSWYRSNLKKFGGWSLEMIDVNYPCTGAPNWAASTSITGGTPGILNSVATDNPDLSPPVIIRTFAPTNGELQFTFDQVLSITPNNQEEIIIEPTIRIDTFFVNSFTEPELTIQLDDTLVEGVIYQVTITGFADCNENIGLNPGSKTPVALAQLSDSADLVINEILFNPRPLGVGFVELYNRSTKALNLKNWRFARWQSGILADFNLLTDDNHMIYPGEYRVFTESVEKLRNQYPAYSPVSMVEVRDLPALGDKQGSIILVEPLGSIVDGFQYHESMHHPLLTDRNGVSLERASPNQPTNEPNNWYSAAEASGYATPGKRNSQRFHTQMVSGLTIAPKLISPLSGRYPAYTRISFQLDKPGNTGSIIIFDSQGHVVKTLLNNAVLPVTGSYQWDGTDDKTRRVPMGYYLVLFKVSQRQGQAWQALQTVVVAPEF